MNCTFNETDGPDLEEFMEFMFVTGQLEAEESESCDEFDEDDNDED